MARTKPSGAKKTGTESANRHTYKSFTQKIANLKIDPVRRIRRHVDDEETERSFFRSSLESWVELNLSATFTEFSRETSQLSESLPHILHYKDRIFDLLVTYISKRDVLALEPLLNLLSQFAHDLGASFEPYFGRAVSVLASLVAKHADFSVIEWTFNCLAYLLKYLSRLLVSDLRPVFEILAPLLGREPQKLFITRFTAEALSFLLRKCREEPLRLIVRHAFKDLQDQDGKPAAKGYAQGLKVMFNEACISVDRTVHSKGPEIVKTMMEISLELEDTTGRCFEICQGVVIALIHHTGSDTFRPVWNIVYEFINKTLLKAEFVSPQRIEMASKLLYTCVAVRKGNRIANWEEVGEIVVNILEKGLGLTGDEEVLRKAIWEALKAAAIVLQTAELQVVVARCGRIVDKAKEFQRGRIFLPFCEFFSELGSERFRMFLLPYFQRFIISHWSEQEDNLCLIIPKLSASGSLSLKNESESTADLLSPKSPITNFAVQSFQALKTNIENPSESGEVQERGLIRAWRYLDVILALPLVGSSTQKGIANQLFIVLQEIFDMNDNIRYAAVAGKALSVCMKIKGDWTKPLGDSFCDAFPRLGSNTVFLRGALDFINFSGQNILIDEEKTSLVVEKLIKNLAAPSHETRGLSLSCLELLYSLKNKGGQQISEVINTAKIIEDTPLEINNARNIAMHIRKLSAEYANVEKDSWESKIVPWYCFGLLTVNFAPVWEDATKTLAKVVEANEEIVAQLAFRWFELQQPEESTGDGKADEAPQRGLTRFECSNLKNVEEVAGKCIFDKNGAEAQLGTMFEDDLKVPKLPVWIARTQSLRVFCEIPQIAEKRSRQFIPIFLDWTHIESAEDIEEETDEPSETLATRWSQKDQSTMLTVLSKFVNPRALFKSETVYIALLHLLERGDPKVQTLALKCIFTWKIPAIRAYQDNLNNLLDDTRFRDEVTHLVQVDEEESMIETAHRVKLMPVLLRILYGRSLSRKNAHSGKGMETRRIVVLAALANFLPEEKAQYIDILLGRLKDVKLVDKSDLEKYRLDIESVGSINVSARKQVGVVRMVEDMLKQLGSTLLPFVETILDALLYCSVFSSKSTKGEEEGEEAASQNSSKAIRKGVFKCLNALFSSCPSFDWKPYMQAFFEEVVNPKLEKLPVDTSQCPSGLLQLFATWAKDRRTVLFLAEYNTTLLRKVAESLGTESVKDEVVFFIIKFLQDIVGLADCSEDTPMDETNAEAVKEKLLRPNVDILLVKLGEILHKSPGKEVLEQGIETVALLAPYVSGDTETTHLVEISVFLLGQPTRRVSPKTKSDILRILLNFLPLCIMKKGDELFEKTFRSVVSLFGFFKDRESREMLAGVLRVFAARDPELVEIAELSQKLNSFSKKRLDEPDFEQRLEAYAAINEEKYKSFSSRQWLPLLYNMLFFIKDNEELAIRTNASYSLKRFAECCGSRTGTEDEDSFLMVMGAHVLPALRNGTREQSELIRMEYVGVMAHVVRECKTWGEVSDMQPLLVGDDDEASFFNNILHIQQHRRSRALRRLASMAQKENIQSSNIAHFFLPLVEHFVFDQAEDAHNLASETVITIGALAEQLSWTQYRSLFRRYTGYIKLKPELEKIIVRLIGTVVDSLSRAWIVASTNPDSTAKETVTGTVDGDEDVHMETTVSKCRLSLALPDQKKLADDMSSGFMPTLAAYLHQKDEATVSLRVPVAISIVKLLKLMPEDMLVVRLPGILTDVCHILRSRSQESRDMTRKTLTEITNLLGPQYFSFVLKELRGALLRGYQLHVLSFTVHSILVAVVPSYSPGDLDYCVSPIVDVIMDDIFGVTGMEKDADGYISKMKEVKSSKSYDSMDLLATTTTLSHLGKLIRPIQALLKENVNLKLVKKIDELLRRIGVGLLKNETVKSQDLLVFCYEIIQETYKADSMRSIEKKVDPAIQRFIVNLKAPSKAASSVTTSSHMYKLTRFALDILRTTLHKYDNLRTPENLAGFIPIIGDALLSNNEEIQISALRLLTTIIRVPLPAIDEGAAVFVKQALSFIKDSPSTNAELPQASLKLIAAILRERRNFNVDETTIAYLLTRIKPDLEEPDRQGVTFNFLKAVLARKIVITEVYEVLDNVAAIMVTNQTRSVRDLSRGIYFQFLMEYPQGKDRFDKQLEFLVTNLDYPHQSGRQSVLEAIHLLITKIGDKLIQNVLLTFFAPLVVALVNDESAECREMTGALLKELLGRADDERLEIILGLLRQWVEQEHRPSLVMSALHVWGMYYEVYKKASQKELRFITKTIQIILQNALDEDYEEANGFHWERVYFALRLWIKIVQIFPEHALSGTNAKTWASVRGCLEFRHAWVRLSAARAMGLLFAEYAKSELSTLPLGNLRGLEMTGEDMVGISRAVSSQLNSPELSDELGLQVVKNLLFLGRCFYANKLAALDSVPQNDQELDDVEEDRELKSALLWLVGRISGVIRSERNIKKGLLGKKYGLQWLAAMTQVISGEDLIPLATKIIMPLYNLVELPETHSMRELKTTAQEILDMVQTRMGTTAYSKAYNQVRQEVQDRRRHRKYKRSIQTVTDPEKAAKQKIRKHEKKRVSRKEKSAVHRDMRKAKRGGY